MPRRGFWGQITSYESDEQRRFVWQLVKDLQTRVDEHGWRFGVQTHNRSGTRGVALSWDCYGIGSDIHTGSPLAVIQIRQTHWNKWGNSSRKSYYLCGYNEDGVPFAHCVEARVIHAAIKKDRDVIYACQTWIFGADYNKVLRQGDVALVPVRSPRGERTHERAASFGDNRMSHLLVADEIRRNGDLLYALNPTLTHNPGTHPPVTARGWYKVVVSRRAAQWDFSKVRID